MKDQMIRNTIMETKKDVDEIKETLDKITNGEFTLTLKERN